MADVKYDYNPPNVVPVPVTTEDSDVPIANAVPITELEPVKVQPTLLKNGRSSRVVVQHDKTPTQLSAHQVQVLKEQGFPKGIINEINRNSQAFPLRIWVVDNSGSMMAQDGHRIVETLNKDNVKLVSCSRFMEIQETVDYHGQMAALLQAPTVFRLLNDPGRAVGPQQFSIAERGEEFIPQDLEVCRRTMYGTQPSGCTPLTQHVMEIRANVLAMEEELRNAGTKVAIVLATDGLPTDRRGYSKPSSRREFANALHSLQGLPVWVVIRLCTDDETVVEYYNNLDAQLELSIEVLDDFMGESEEVNSYNSWLNYALPLHRVREMGFNHRLLDLLDERKFTLDEVAAFVRLLFGDECFDGVPDPHMDFTGFLDSLASIVHNEKRQWNPRTKKMEPWINMKKLKKIYGRGGGCSIM